MRKLIVCAVHSLLVATVIFSPQFARADDIIINNSDGDDGNDTAGSWWSAGAMILGSLGLLLGGLWMTVATAGPVERAAKELGQGISPESAIIRPDSQDKKRKSESIVTDSKTGMEQRVFTGIELTTNKKDKSKTRDSSLSMKYTNVMAYSFIPARVAKQLAATELGEIDFGAAAPVKKRPFQAMLKWNGDGLPKPAPIVKSNTDKQLAKPITYVRDLTRPVEDGTTIVPYPDDAVWVPGHLTFYGLNQTKQHRFKVVRIDNVALGVGPEFGPVNALVLDDENSDFGLLGMDWIQQVRGEKGEGLWFVAAEGALYFMAGKVRDEPVETAVPSEPTQSRVTVESRGREKGPARMERSGVKVLATHTYSQTKRVSTGWVEFNGLRSPVDVGIQHDGVNVYQTLMFDIVAVDAKTDKSIWKIDWGKTTPMWQTVSIVELDRGGKSELAVELYAAVKKTDEMIYEYYSLKTGKKVDPPRPLTGDSDQQQESKTDGSRQLKFKTVERDGDRITRAVVNGFPHGRSATELIQHFAQGARDRSMLQAGSTTNMELIVSASKPNYLLEDRMEATEIVFNLPEGSGLRAEFSGKNVEIKRGDQATTVIVTNGKIELIDAGGVIRAWASPDGGAEQLVVVCRENLGEVAMTMKTRRIKESPEYPNPPVQVVMNTKTGAPKDEGDPPHGAIRYEILQDDKKPEKQVRMKMKWRYEMKRLLEEAKAESGLSVDELIDGGQNQSPQMRIPLSLIPQQGRQVESKQDDSDDSTWGRLAEISGLRSRLTLLTESPAVGKPLLFKLEVKNFGDKPTGVDAQRYEPFRVLRANQADGKSAKFIGMTPQTSGEIQQLKPGESLTLWENVDANGLFLIKAGGYKFMAEGGEWATQTLWRDSNTVNVQVADGEPSPVNQLLEKLSEGLPNKWKVASGMGLAEGWKGVFLTHAPTSLKRDATGVQIWFTEDKLADDFELGSGDQKQVVTQLGQSKLGFMNVAAQPRTPDIWPGYLEHIRKAAKPLLKR